MKNIFTIFIFAYFKKFSNHVFCLSYKAKHFIRYWTMWSSHLKFTATEVHLALIFVKYPYFFFLLPIVINRHFCQLALKNIKASNIKVLSTCLSIFWLCLYFISICVSSNIFRCICFSLSKPIISPLHISCMQG